MREQHTELLFLRAALAGRAAELAVALLGQANRAMSSKRELRFGRHGSMAVMISGPKAGTWFDHEIGKGGDLFGFIMRERGNGFRDAVKYAEEFVGRAPVEIVPAYRAARPVPDDTGNTRIALNIWREAVPVVGTIAETYLESRGICDLVRFTDHEALRFHPRCPWRHNAGDPIIKVPALIGLFRDIFTDAPYAIHRRPLTADGRKLGKPKALGPSSGCVIKISATMDVDTRLTIGEGVETTLSGMAINYRPAWALGSAGELAKFPVLEGVESITILVDNDKSGTGQAAALACSKRWTGAGREVFRFVPRQTGADVNDLLVARLAIA